MPIARITSHGLAVIAVLVCALWSCILAENSISRSARLVRLSSLHELQMLRNGLRKVHAPDGERMWRGVNARDHSRA
jgi:hypothetical protein